MSSGKLLSNPSISKELLFKSRLIIGKISYHQDQDLVPYTVLDQSIKDGTVLDKSTTINLVVSVLDIQDIFTEDYRIKNVPKDCVAITASAIRCERWLDLFEYFISTN